MSASFDLTEKTRLSADYELRSGEVVSYAVPPRPDLVAWRTIGGWLARLASPYVAYNFDAITNTLSFGVSQALTQWVSVNARYEWHYTTRSNHFLHEQRPATFDPCGFLESLLFLVTSAATAGAGDLTVAVSDQNGKPVKDAVVYAMPVSGQPPSRKAAGRSRATEQAVYPVRQRDSGRQPGPVPEQGHRQTPRLFLLAGEEI